MDFEPSPEQAQLAESLSRLLNDHYDFQRQREICAGEPGFSERLWHQRSDLGVTALGIPQAFGGLGGGAVERLPVIQAQGRALLNDPYMASDVLGATAVNKAGDTRQRRELLPGIAAGTIRLAWAHDEPAGGHAPLWIETRAQCKGGTWRLDGSKTLVLCAVAAARFIVSARVEGASDDADGLALFLVDPGAGGLRLRNGRLVDDTPTGDLALQSTPAEPLGSPADTSRAHSAIRATVNAGTAAACADMLGATEAAFRLSVEYLNTRKQFGQAIGQNQALRHRVAEMFVSLELARSMAIAAAVAADHPALPDSASDLSRAKLVIGRHARSLCEAAIQLHGGAS